MRRLVLCTVLVVSAVLLFATPSSAHLAAEPGLEACDAAVESQIAAGVEAGGGPKAGEPGPLNCDQFYFFIGAIGHDHSGGP